MSDRIAELREFVKEVDGDLQRFFPFSVEKVSATGNKDDLPGTYFVNGLASVYNKWSLDLGGFRERIKPGAFDNVLKTDPHVLHVWDHDTSKILSSTRNKTLELKSVKEGLHYHSKVAPTSYAQDLQVLLARGDIDQSSFAFIPVKDEWRIKEEDGGVEIVERTIVEVGELFDVTTCAMGAYPQTDAALAVRSMARGNRTTSVLIPSSVVSVREADGDVAPEEVGDPQPDPVPEPAPTPEEEEARKREFALWQEERAAQYRRTREFAFGVQHKEEGEA